MKTTITQNQIFRTFSRLQRSCCSAVFLLLFLLSASSSWGQIAQRGSATTSNNASSTVTINKPTGLQVGDIMIATINQADNDDNTLSDASRSGWTTIPGAKYYSGPRGNDEWWGTVLYKIATSTDVSATNFQFTGDSDADNMQGSIIAFSGVNTSNPIDVQGTFTSQNTDNTSLSPSSITTLTDKAALLILAMSSASVTYSGWSTTSPGTLTELFELNYSSASLPMSIGGAWAIKTTPGATGNGSATTSANARDGSILLSLRCTPSIASQSTAAQTKCINTNFNSISVTAAGTGLTYQWYSNNSASASGGTSLGTSNGAQTATYTPQSSVLGTKYYYCIVSNGCGSVTSSVSGAFTVSSPTSVTASANVSTICAGGAVNLTSSATSNSSTEAVLINENFNNTPTGWTTTNSSTGGTPSNAAWTLRANNYNYTTTTSTVLTFNSNDASQFYLSNSDAQGGSTTVTSLISPSFNTTGLSSASISFFHYYQFNSSESAKVQISSNGLDWTDITTYSATVGASNGFVNANLSIPSNFIGLANVYIRFNYNATDDWFWAIDNVSVTGTFTTPPAATFAWTASPSGFTSALQNPTSVTPSANTTYTVTATNSYGCTATASTTVNVNSVTAGSIANAQTICSGGDPAAFTSTAGTGSGTITYRWESNTNLSTPSWSTIANETAATYDVPSGLTTTTQYRRITISTLNSVACESAATSAVQVTVNALPTSLVLTGSTVCSGSTTTITSSTSQSGVNYQLFNSSNTAVGSAIAGTGSALTWSAISAGTGYYVVGTNTTTSCVSANSNAVNVTVNALPNSPTAISYNCTGSAVLTATAGSGETVAWYATNSQSASPVGGQVTSSNTATLTIASPTAATYYAFATNANGCNSANGTETPVEVTAKNTYTGTNSDWFTAGNWSCGAVPTASTNVVIPTGKTVSISYTPGNGPAEAGTVTLEGTAALTVTTDHDLTVTGKVTVASGANFTVQNNASLKQIDNIANSGEIKVNRSTRALKLYDGVLWSSPVAGQVVNSLASGMNPNYIKYYNVASNTWNVLSNPSGTTFPKGTAYLMRTPSTGFNLNSATPWSVTFTGVPNNGDIEVTGPSVTTPSSEQYYLVGNPYPSAIDLNEFMNSNPNVTGVFYFFRKTDNSPYSAYGVLTKTQTSPGSGSYSNSYNENHPTEGAVNPNDVIPVGQGFFVTMKTGVEGKVFFNNNMRLVTNHGTFNRLQINTEDKFKLNLTTTSNAANFSQMNLGYAEGSSSSYDVGYDAESFNDGRTNLSSMIATTPFSIQSRGTYAASDVVPLYFKTNVNGEHRIKLQDAQGVFAADQMVIIKDNLTGVQHNLTANGDYVFTATAGTFTNRFEVVYQQAYYTALQANSCGATIANMNSLVYADLINGATGYRFKVVNNTTSAVQTIDRPQHWFAFNMLSSYDYNTAYTISVQVQKDGVWTGYYGATCTVNSPNIAATGVMQINPSQCGMTLPTLGTVIATTPVAGATGYKFRITNTTAGAIGNNLVQEITRTNHWFSLGMLPRYNYGSSYAIEVAVKTTGGYTAYGNACTVYSPAVPTLATCGQNVATATTLVRTTAMNLATQYRFQVTRMSTQETITFDTANYWFSFRVNVPGYAAGEQYGVRVAVMTAGAWSPYGDACDITAPIATARTTEEAAPSEAGLFKPVAYPNPFASTFGISLATPSADVVHVMVYDLQGRLIEKQNVFVSQLDSLQIGTNYPSGDYLLVVAQGANIKSSHIHKD